MVPTYFEIQSKIGKKRLYSNYVTFKLVMSYIAGETT